MTKSVVAILLSLVLLCASVLIFDAMMDKDSPDENLYSGSFSVVFSC